MPGIEQEDTRRDQFIFGEHLACFFHSSQCTNEVILWGLYTDAGKVAQIVREFLGGLDGPLCLDRGMV